VDNIYRKKRLKN